ncbi:MAG: glycosyltransferase family 39 protein, partial [Candidatus Levybacteria bacterium]|nr:glycosyltransferase family 39 protein [Candidatus Levybacteria bacterium]
MKFHTIILIIIVVLAFLVRVIGTNPGHWEYHPDEPTTYITAKNMIINHDINPRRFDYPAGMPIIHMIAFNSFFIPAQLIGLFFEKPDVLIAGFLDFQNFPGNITEDLFGYRGIIALFWSRYITAVLGALCVIALYMLCNLLFNDKDKSKITAKTKKTYSFFRTSLLGNSYSRAIGLIASFFLAFNFLSVLRSQLGLPEIPNALFTILSLIAIVRLLKEDSPKNYYITALVIGFAFAIKFQVFVLLPFAFVHILWSIRKKSFSNLFRKEVFLSGIIVIATFFALNPYLPLHLAPVPIDNRVDSFITSNDYTARRYALGSNVFNPFPLFFLYKWGIGKAITLSILAGAGLMLFKSPVRFFILMFAIVPFMYTFVYYGGAGAGYYVRNYATIIPLLLIFAAFLYAYILHQILKRKLLSKPIIGGLITILLVAVSWDQISSSINLAYYGSKPWLHVVTAQWAGEHLPKDAKIEESSGLMQGHMRQFGNFTNLVTWGGGPAYDSMSLAEVEENNTDFVALVSIQIHHRTISWMNPLTFSELFTYDDVPYEKLDNTYLGLLTYQMFDHTVYGAYYPVEYPNKFYIISKVPKTDAKLIRNLKSFEFDESDSTWTPVRLDKQDTANIAWVKEEGYQAPGSLKLQSANSSLTRFSSPALPVEEGKTYQIVGKVKQSQEVSKEERSVFLRLDLYSDKSSFSNMDRGDYVAVSARKWGDTQWGELKATTIKIPKGVKYMTISLQADKPMPYDVYLDSVVVSEVVLEERYPDIPVTPVRIPSDYIYPKAI